MDFLTTKSLFCLILAAEKSLNRTSGFENLKCRDLRLRSHHCKSFKSTNLYTQGFAKGTAITIPAINPSNRAHANTLS